jgi:hypothetical protein
MPSSEEAAIVTSSTPTKESECNSQRSKVPYADE